MRTAYGMIGLGFLIILGGLYFINNRFTPLGDTSKDIFINSTSTMSSTLTLTSTAFADNESIPSKYTCDDQRDLNPPLTIAGVPAGAKSLVLIVDDPDVPKVKVPSGVVDHWILFNVPPSTSSIPEGGSAGVAGVNTHGDKGYMGPCPPPEYEPSRHRYFFKLYALDTELTLAAGASKSAVEEAMSEHVIGKTQLVGTYKRK